MFFPDVNAEKGATEEGTVDFVGSSMYKVKWLYKDHVIEAIFPRYDASFHLPSDPEPGIKITYCGFDVSNRYLEYLNNVERATVRTTLDNLAIVIGVIDKNLEEYIEKTNE